ncbi:hypothetical protein Y032_0012g1654 [Ancylostoma ceylanicum]|uniref:Uncharacterized protein n=1 Tax=Ancylostoma ceylanicum TaxID=53326 RepID=A0A016VE80_9BILA|nr:hypothetical protein Y032_0012g1654 [Ancylostoma ceylanicum]
MDEFAGYQPSSARYALNFLGIPRLHLFLPALAFFIPYVVLNIWETPVSAGPRPPHHLHLLRHSGVCCVAPQRSSRHDTCGTNGNVGGVVAPIPAFVAPYSACDPP